MIEGRTLWELLERRVEETPEGRMLLDEGGNVLTFSAFKGRAERVAAGLHERGIGEGTTVSWQLPTRMDTVVLSMALARLGAVQNPILHVYREREVRFALQQLEPSLFVIPGTWRGFDFETMATGILGELDSKPELLVVEHGLPEGDPAALPAVPDTADEPVRWIYYTSGTTSDPKGVQHTDRTLVAGGRGLAVALNMSTEDVGSIAFPFSHIAGPDYLVTILMCGLPAVLVEAFVPADAVEVYRRLGVTMAGGSTAFYTAFLTEQRKQPGQKVVPTLRLLSGGGAPKPPEIYFEVKREMGIPVVHGYGMTEVPMISMGAPDGSDD